MIIGSGLGGLVCGAILGMHGYKVCILEKNRQIGGCLQTYARDKTIIDTGVHYIGGLGDGQTLNQIFKYLGILHKLKLKQLDENSFDQIVFGDDTKAYKLAQGYDNFIKQLSADFPGEETNIRTYCARIKEVCSKFPLYNLRIGDYKEKEEVLDIDTAGFISSITGNRRLQQVLGGNSLLYAGVADRTPLYIHALIMNSFIESAWKCVDGGSQIAKQLHRKILEHGGIIRRNARATSIFAEDTLASHIELENGEIIKAKYFISNIHPAQTVEMTQSKLFRGAYRSRMKTLENTAGMFMLNIVVKERTFPYINHNYYYHENNNAWEGANYPAGKWPLTYAMFCNASSKDESFTDSLTIMTYMNYNEVQKWTNTYHTDTIGDSRGADYEGFKKEKAEQLLNVVAKKFPHLRNSIQSYYVATPLTYRDYQGTADGSMYGIAKDYKDTYKTFIAPRTKVPNLFLTGQNLNLHGILGVTISALMTCGEIIDMSSLVAEINNA